jgi:DNA repair protein RadC
MARFAVGGIFRWKEISGMNCLSGPAFQALIAGVKPGRKLVEFGAQSCSDPEILAILLGSGGHGYTALDAARALLDKYGTLGSLMDQPLDEIAAIRGIKSVRAIRLAAVFEFCQRVLKEIDREA